MKAIYDTLAFNGGSTDLMENAKSFGFCAASCACQRPRTDVYHSTNAQYFAKYQNKDLTDIDDVHFVKRHTELSTPRSFGNDGHVISDLLKRAQANGLTNAEEESLIPTIRGWRALSGMT